MCIVFNTYEEFLRYFPNASFGTYMEYLRNRDNRVIGVDTLKGEYKWKYE